MKLLQAFFNLFFGGFGFLGTSVISLGNITLFFTIIISYPRDFLRFLPGFLGEGGFRRFIISFRITVSLRIILRWLVGCLAPFYIAAL